MILNYITSDPGILGGKPIVKGTRISVQMIIEWMASGATIEDIVQEYKHLPREGVIEALLYASNALKNEILFEARILNFAA